MIDIILEDDNKDNYISASFMYDHNIERDKFCKILKKYFKDFDELFDLLEECFETEHFKFIRDCYTEECGILYISSDLILGIFWYKYTHVGRSLRTVGIKNYKELNVFLRALRKELNKSK